MRFRAKPFDITNAELLMTVILPHKEQAEHILLLSISAEKMAKDAYNNLVKGYKDNRWTGEMNGEIPALTPPPLKPKEGGEEEE